MRNLIYNEPNLVTMARMPDNFVDCVITSPPYYGLRQYLCPNPVVLRSDLSEEKRKLILEELEKHGIKHEQSSE